MYTEANTLFGILIGAFTIIIAVIIGIVVNRAELLKKLRDRIANLGDHPVGPGCEQYMKWKESIYFLEYAPGFGKFRGMGWDIVYAVVGCVVAIAYLSSPRLHIQLYDGVLLVPLASTLAVAVDIFVGLRRFVRICKEAG